MCTHHKQLPQSPISSSSSVLHYRLYKLTLLVHVIPDGINFSPGTAHRDGCNDSLVLRMQQASRIRSACRSLPRVVTVSSGLPPPPRKVGARIAQGRSTISQARYSTLHEDIDVVAMA